MKKYEDIISRFDNIQELSVSEEMVVFASPVWYTVILI